MIFLMKLNPVIHNIWIMMCFTRVIYGDHMIHFPCTIVIKNITHFIILCLSYHENFLYDEWVHGTCQGNEVFYGWSLVEGRNRRLF